MRMHYAAARCRWQVRERDVWLAGVCVCIPQEGGQQMEQPRASLFFVLIFVQVQDVAVVVCQRRQSAAARRAALDTSARTVLENLGVEVGRGEHRYSIFEALCNACAFSLCSSGADGPHAPLRKPPRSGKAAPRRWAAA